VSVVVCVRGGICVPVLLRCSISDRVVEEGLPLLLLLNLLVRRCCRNAVTQRRQLSVAMGQLQLKLRHSLSK
jgi:hypothetical protein